MIHLFRRRYRNPEILSAALALALAFTCSSRGEETDADLPPPAIPPKVLEESEKMPERGLPELPGDETLIPELPPDALPAGVFSRTTPSNRQGWMEEEAAAPPQVTEAPTPEPLESTNADVARDVAISQAISTGETLLGSLGGLNGLLYSPFLGGQYNAPMQNSSAALRRPLRLGSFDVNVRASLGVIGTFASGAVSKEGYSTSGLLQAGFTAVLGREGLSSLWLTYDIGSTYPDASLQGRQSGGGNSGGLDQNLSLMANVVFPEMRRVKFVLGVNYASLSGIDRDTGGGGRRQIATGTFLTSFEYSEKTSFDWNVSIPVRQFSNAVSSNGITSTLFANNKVTRKTSIGLGYTIGTLTVDGGADQLFQQALGRVKYEPTRFLSCEFTLGADFRDAGDAISTTPIFGLSATWDSHRGTSVSLAAERRIFNAASAINTNFTSTSIVLSVGQRLALGMLSSLSAGYEYTDYQSIGDSGQGNRNDKLTYASASLLAPLSRHWNCSLSVAAGKNRSDVEAFDFLEMTLKTSLAF